MRKKNTGSAKKELLSGKSPIWWSVDPFHDDISFHAHALAILKPFAKALGTPIVPVTYIDAYRALEEPGYRFPLIPLSSEPVSTLKVMAEERIQEIASCGFEKLVGPPIFLGHETNDSPSLRQKVETISKKAKQNGAVFVALHSHSHSGIKRLYMGSFAETFMLNSKAPTLVFNPKCLPPARIRQILFPTDFSDESLSAFEVILELAAKFKAKVTVAHYFHIPSLFQFLHESDRRQFQAELKDKESLVRRDGVKFEEKGAKKGVKTKFHLLADEGLFDASAGLIKFANSQKIDLIALAAQSGSLKTTLLGATSREIARNAKCPVFIYRP